MNGCVSGERYCNASLSQSGLSDGARATYEAERVTIGMPDGESETFKALGGYLEGLLRNMVGLNERENNMSVLVFLSCIVLMLWCN